MLSLRPTCAWGLRHGQRPSLPPQRKLGLRRAASSSDQPSERRNEGRAEDEEAQPQSLSSAMHYSLSEVARLQGRISNKTNLFLVNESEDEWRKLDKKVNKYPIQRAFTAIGTGGGEFKASMVKAVEDVVGAVHVECISERSSSKGSYISVTVGPVWVESCDQIIEIYSKMKEVGSGNIKFII